MFLRLFRPAFEVRSTQTVVKIYNKYPMNNTYSITKFQHNCQKTGLNEYKPVRLHRWKSVCRIHASFLIKPDDGRWPVWHKLSGTWTGLLEPKVDKTGFKMFQNRQIISEIESESEEKVFKIQSA